MSYDLMVFDLSAAPQNTAEFLDWAQEQMSWPESHPYDDPAISSPGLQGWFAAMCKTFPPMNGALSDEDMEDIDDDYLTDYSIGQKMIYAAFSWNTAEEAYEQVKLLAVDNNIGFYDVSGKGEIIRPEGKARTNQGKSGFKPT